MNISILVDTAVTVPVNITALLDDSDFKTREESVTFNQSGLDLVWNFVTAGGVITQTAVTPTDTAGVYDWTNVGNGMYKIEIPASGGGTINNDAEGFGYFTGFATGILPWRGPTIAFLKANIINALVVGSDVLEVDSVAVSGDTVAADNLELQYDTTGLSGDTFPATQASVKNIGTVGGGLVNYAASEDNASLAIKGISSVGTPTGTFANLTNEDGTLLDILDAANDIDWILGFDIGGANRASAITIFANLNGNADEMVIQVYNFVDTDWDTVGTLLGAGGNAFFTRLNPSLLAEHTGTGSDLGKVYVRFETLTTTPSQLQIDKCTVGVVSVTESIGYENASVWINETSGVAGVEPGVNGVSDNPCISYANAIAIASAVGLNRYTFATGDTITLTQSHVFDSFFGLNYILALANQVPPTYTEGAEVTGIANGTTTHYMRDSRIGTTGTALTLNAGMVAIQCGIVNIKLKDAGAAALDVEFLDCHGNTQGSMSGGTVDFGTTAGTNHELSLQRWGGPITFENLKAGDTIFMHGNGSATLAASCTGGSFRCAGEINLTDNSGAAVTIVDDGRLVRSAIVDDVWDELKSAHTTPNTFGDFLDTEVSGVGGGGGDATEAKQDTIITNLSTVDGVVDAILIDTATTIPGTITTIDTNVDSILVDTAVIGAAGAGLTDLGGMSTGMKGEVNAEADAALVTYDAPTKAEMDTAHGLLATEAKQDIIDTNVDAVLVDTATTIPALVNALNDISTADVNAQVLDVINVDTLIDGKTLSEAVQIVAAIVAGKLSGAGTGTETAVGLDASTTRAVVTVDGSGNKTAVTY